MGRLEGQTEDELIELKGEMSKQKPGHSLVTTCLETIREIAIGAAEPAVYGGIMQALIALGGAAGR